MKRNPIEQSMVLMIGGAVAASLAVGIGLTMTGCRPVFAVLGAVAALGGFAALASNEAALCLLVIVGASEGIIKGLFPGMLTLLLKDIIIGVALLRWAWEGLNGLPRPSLNSPVVLPVFLFAVLCAGQMFNTETGSFLVALAGFRSWVASIAIFFIAYDTLDRSAAARRVGWWVVLVGVATSIYGIVQHQIGFDHLYALSSGFDFYRKFGSGETVRAASTYVAPASSGARPGPPSSTPLASGSRGG